MKLTCRICDKVTKSTQASYRTARLANNTCKECQYILEEFKIGINWLKEYR